MDTLADLLQQKKPDEPPQLQALKNYVKTHHDQEAQVAVTHTGYSLTIRDASLATVLRMELPRIQAECNLDKKLFIRIAHF